MPEVEPNEKLISAVKQLNQNILYPGKLYALKCNVSPYIKEETTEVLTALDEQIGGGHYKN